MTASGLDLDKYELIASAAAVTARWPAQARVEFSAFVLRSSRSDLPALDGDTPRERAANARELARYWFRDWMPAHPGSRQSRRDRASGLGPRASGMAKGARSGGPQSAARSRPRTLSEALPPSADLAQIAAWAARFGVAHAVDLWRSERGRT